MPIPLACPSCFAKLRAPDKMAGRETKCPKCGAAVTVPTSRHENLEIARASPPLRPVPPVAPPTVQPDGPPPPVLITPDEDFNFEPSSRRRLRTADSISHTVVVREPSRAAHSLGIAALVVGVVSFSLCWIPFLGIAVSGLGLTLGLGGLVLAVARGGSGVGFSIAGSGLSAISLMICLAWTFAVSNAVKAVRDAATNLGQTNQTLVPNADRVKSGPQGSGGEQQHGQGQPSSAAARSEPEWVDARKGAVRQGDIQVRVAGVSVGKVPLEDAFSEGSKSKDDFLMVKLELKNTSSTRKVEYHTWSGRDLIFERDYATLRDNFDNVYKRVSFGQISHPVGAVERSESIYPGKSISDVLVFEVPVDTIEYLRLELPAKNFGGTGMLRLQIPKSMINR